MTWPEFLKSIARAPKVTLIGPLFSPVGGKSYVPETPTIFVDGGSHFRKGGPSSVLSIAVGDGDSCEGALDHVLPGDKDYSDLAFALRELPASVDRLELLGFLGGRRDHELLNLGAVHHFLKGASRLRTARFIGTDAKEEVIAFNGEGLSLNVNGTFSLVVFERANVTLTGSCKYKLEKPTPLLEVSSVGLSNEGFGMITVGTTSPCFIFAN